MPYVAKYARGHKDEGKAIDFLVVNDWLNQFYNDLQNALKRIDAQPTASDTRRFALQEIDPEVLTYLRDNAEEIKKIKTNIGTLNRIKKIISDHSTGYLLKIQETETDVHLKNHRDLLKTLDDDAIEGLNFAEAIDLLKTLVTPEFVAALGTKGNEADSEIEISFDKQKDPQPKPKPVPKTKLVNERLQKIAVKQSVLDSAAASVRSDKVLDKNNFYTEITNKINNLNISHNVKSPADKQSLPNRKGRYNNSPELEINKLDVQERYVQPEISARVGEVNGKPAAIIEVPDSSDPTKKIEVAQVVDFTHLYVAKEAARTLAPKDAGTDLNSNVANAFTGATDAFIKQRAAIKDTKIDERFVTIRKVNKRTKMEMDPKPEDANALIAGAVIALTGKSIPIFPPKVLKVIQDFAAGDPNNIDVLRAKLILKIHGQAPGATATQAQIDKALETYKDEFLTGRYLELANAHVPSPTTPVPPPARPPVGGGVGDDSVRFMSGPGRASADLTNRLSEHGRRGMTHMREEEREIPIDTRDNSEEKEEKAEEKVAETPNALEETLNAIQGPDKVTVQKDVKEFYTNLEPAKQSAFLNDAKKFGAETAMRRMQTGRTSPVIPRKPS